MLSSVKKLLLTQRLKRLVKQYLRSTDCEDVDKYIELLVYYLELRFDMIDKFTAYAEPISKQMGGKPLKTEIHLAHLVDDFMYCLEAVGNPNSKPTGA